MSDAASQKSVLAAPAAIVVAYALARAWLLHEAALADIPHRETLTGFVAWPAPLDSVDQLWPVLGAWLIGPLLAAALGFHGERPFGPRLVGWARALGLAMAPLAVATGLLLVAAQLPTLRTLAFGAWFLAWPALTIVLSVIAARAAEARRTRRWLGDTLALSCVAAVELGTLWPWWKQLLVSGMP